MLLAATTLPTIFPGIQLPGSGNKPLQAGSFSASASNHLPALGESPPPSHTTAVLHGVEEMLPAN